MWALAGRDTLYLVGILLLAGLLLFFGRDLLQGSVLVTWGLTFGGTTAVVVLVAALYRVRIELRRSRRQLARREAELTFAREVQRALFPKHLPSGDGLEFSAVCIPARGISGDYYDVMQLPDGRVVLAVADISGKGVPAAILMANLQAVLRMIVESGRSPGEVVSKLSQHLHQVTDASKFATFFYAEWNKADRLLRYVNAGHHSPIVIGSCRGQRLERGGLPLGVFPDLEFQTGEVELAAGDIIVVYSDGITEAVARSGDEFGEQRLEKIVESLAHEPLAEIQRRVLEAVRNWTNREPQDDMTLLLVRATGQLAGRSEEN